MQNKSFTPDFSPVQVRVRRGSYLETMMRDSRRKGTTKNFDQVVGISYLLQLRITQPRTYLKGQ
jgi:hypothetical protein